MSYGKVKKLLLNEYENFDDMVLIESPFVESTRKGKHLRLLHLALTPSKIVIASETRLRSISEPNCYKQLECNDDFELRSMYPLDFVTLKVFKRIHRQSLKVSFKDGRERYFELNIRNNKRKIFWDLWCNHIGELNSKSKLWPFSISTNSDNNESGYKINRRKWCDKYLYLGSKREIEDNVRPAPIPGLGLTEEIKLLYLKPQYFGCWEQSEHWVQCERSNPEMNTDYDVYTYTGEPTSNIVYSSVVTTWKQTRW